MTFYLGRPGTLLAALPHPLRGINPSVERPSSVLATIGGGRVVSRAPGPGRRRYELAWRALTQDQYSVLEELYTGARGPGPFALLDPGRRNHLSANQAAAGSVEVDGAGFTPSTGETVTVTTTPVLRGPYALVWSLPAAGGSAGILTLDGPGGQPGHPIPAGQPWTFHAQVRGGGADQAVTVTAVLAWLDASGFAVATTLGTPADTSGAGWTQVTVSAAAPPTATAVFVRPELRVTTGTSSSTSTGRGRLPPMPLRRVYGRAMAAPSRAYAGGAAASSVLADWWFGQDVQVLVDQPQLEMSAAPRAWVMGTGVPLVAFLDLPTTYRTLPAHAATASLVEVG